MEIEEIQNAEQASFDELYIQDSSIRSWKVKRAYNTEFSSVPNEKYSIRFSCKEDGKCLKLIDTRSLEFRYTIKPIIEEWAIIHGYAKKNDYFIREIYDSIEDPWSVEGGEVFSDAINPYIIFESYELAKAKDDINFGPITLSEDHTLMITKKLTETLDRNYNCILENKSLIRDVFFLKETDFIGTFERYRGEIRGTIFPECKHLIYLQLH